MMWLKSKNLSVSELKWGHSSNLASMLVKFKSFSREGGVILKPWYWLQCQITHLESITDTWTTLLSCTSGVVLLFTTLTNIHDIQRVNPTAYWSPEFFSRGMSWLSFFFSGSLTFDLTPSSLSSLSHSLPWTKMKTWYYTCQLPSFLGFAMWKKWWWLYTIMANSCSPNRVRISQQHHLTCKSL